MYWGKPKLKTAKIIKSIPNTISPVFTAVLTINLFNEVIALKEYFIYFSIIPTKMQLFDDN
jgi:hypothetical protein